MKRSIIYTAVFSAMLMVTGCGGGDSSSSTEDNKQNLQLDTSPIKKNQLYSATVDGISSYYLDDGQNQISYFHENNLWHGVVKNKEGKTKFSFSEDLTEFFAFNDKENKTLRIKQIDNQTIYQTVIDSLGVTIESVAYFQEGNQFFIAPLNGTEIDKTQKIDITQAYLQGVQQAQNTTNYSASIAANISSAAKNAIDGMIASRSFTRASNQQQPCDLINNWGLAKDVAGMFLKTGIISIGIAVAAPVILPVAAQFVATAAFKTGLSIAVGAVIGWKGGEIYDKNQKAHDELVAIKNELAEEEQKARNDRKQCLVGETLVSGVCKKVEPICDVGETLFYGICTKKVEPECSAGETFINGACKKVEPICDVDEVLVDGACKKKTPVCAADETLVDGVCIKEEIKTCKENEIQFPNGECVEKEKTKLTKFNVKGKKLTADIYGNYSEEVACTLDGTTGLMWEMKTYDRGYRDSRHRYTWFEDSSGYADPRDILLKNIESGRSLALEVYGQKDGMRKLYQQPNDVEPYGFHCDNTLDKCNTKAFLEKINKEKLCGYSDWRLPHPLELEQIGEAVSLTYYEYLFYTNPIWSNTTVPDYPGYAWGAENRLVTDWKVKKYEKVAATLNVAAVRDAF